MHFTTEPPVKTSLPWYLSVVALICMLILIANGWSLHSNLASLQAANAHQSRTAQVTDKVQYLNVLIMDAESSLRGYYLSGSDVYLGPMRTAAAEIDKQANDLNSLLADNPMQRRNLAQLRTLLHRKLDNMNQTLEVYRQGGLEDIVAIAGIDDDKALLDEIRLQVVIMVQEQSEQLSSNRAGFYKEYEYAVVAGIGINAAALLVLALFYRLIRRGYFARVSAQRMLQNANDNLESMVALRTEQLSVLSRHLISVSETEKASLARELHDELGANLTAINIDVNAVADRLRAHEPVLADMLDRARGTLLNTVELKRRIVEDLRPSMLDNLGLAMSLQSYCSDFARVTGVDCEALIEGDIDTAGSMQSIAVFRIVQESLNNIAKYAQAKQVIVHVAREGNALSLEINDDGVGIDLHQAATPKSHGLLGMRERALLLGGTLQVKRGVNNRGTTVEATIPVANIPAPGETTGQPLQLPDNTISVPHPSASGHTRSLPPYSIRRHIPQGLDG